MWTTFKSRLTDDDWINPIVIKELRQAIQGRFIAAVLMLFLLISLLTLGGFLLFQDEVTRSSEMGRGAVYVFQGLVAGTCILFIPAYTLIRLWSERSDNNTDLMFISTIAPRAIIWGKWLASSILAVVVFSACAPFMTLSNLLGGVSLPVIFIIMLYGLAVVCMLNMFALLVASLTTSIVGRVLLGLASLNMLVNGIWTVVGGSVGLGETLARTSYDMDFWMGMSTGALSMILGTGLMYFFAVAMIKPVSSNRALPVRIYMTVMALILAMVFISWAWFEQEEDIVGVWMAVTIHMFILYFAVAICERETWGPRVRRTIPRNPLARLFALVFYSGAAGGMAWSVLMMGLTLIVGVVALTLIQTSPTFFDLFDLDENGLRYAVVMAAYTYAYGMTAYLLRPLVKPTITWTLMLILLAIGVSLPLLLTWLVLGQSIWNNQAMYFAALTNPFLALDDDYFLVCMVFTAFWSLIATIIAAPRLIRQLIDFKPLNQNLTAKSAMKTNHGDTEAQSENELNQHDSN